MNAVQAVQTIYADIRQKRFYALSKHDATESIMNALDMLKGHDLISDAENPHQYKITNTPWGVTAKGITAEGEPDSQMLDKTLVELKQGQFALDRSGDPEGKLAALRQLVSFGLADFEKGTLTDKGTEAIELGGFFIWKAVDQKNKAQRSTALASNSFHINGSNNTVQSSQGTGPVSQTLTSTVNEQPAPKHLEKASWWSSIISTLLSVFSLSK